MDFNSLSYMVFIDLSDGLAFRCQTWEFYE